MASLLFATAITALPLKNFLDLCFFPIYKPHEACCSEWTSRPRRVNLINFPFLVLGAKSAVLTEDLKGEDSKSNEAGNATNKEQAPEALQRKLI